MASLICIYLAISTSDGRVEDEVWRGEDVYEGDGVGLELSAEMEDGIPDETAAPGAGEIATWVIKKEDINQRCLKALFNNVSTLKNLGYTSLHAISVFHKV